MTARGNKTIIAAACAALLSALLGFTPAWADPTDRHAAIKQVAAFTERQRAMELVNSLAQEGKTALILEKSINSVTYYAVLVDSMPRGISQTEPQTPMIANTPVEPPPAPKAEETKAPEISSINEGPFEEVTLEPVNPDSKQTIALMSNTPVYISPVEGAPFIGTYRSLGKAQYVGPNDGWHALLLQIDNYGYVRGTDARTVPFEPKAGQEQK